MDLRLEWGSLETQPVGEAGEGLESNSKGASPEPCADQTRAVILNNLRIPSKVLLANVIDSLVQMTVESKSLQPFLEACSNTLFFILALCCLELLSLIFKCQKTSVLFNRNFQKSRLTRSSLSFLQFI